MWPPIRVRAVRAAEVVAGVLMVAVYLLAAVSTITSIVLLAGFTSSATVPAGGFYFVASIFVSVALTATALRYVYYYRCWSVSRRYFGAAPHVDAEALARRDVPNLKVQITTKGGALPVVQRSLEELEAILQRQPWLVTKLSAEVITEKKDEADALTQRFRGSALNVTALPLPEDYATPNGTRLKARALHYMVERRRAGFNAKPGRTFIIHFDEETLVEEPQLLVLVDYLAGEPAVLSQGPIVYPLEWKKTPWICRALESTRPFGCSECARVMEHPPPPHLHGSNLVVDEAAENQLGWDFGTIEGQPYVAEDLLFGLRAYAALGASAFGWHGATMLEQPPFSLYWAVQQRMRWVLGALQGLSAMFTRAEFNRLSAREKRRLTWAISFRVGTYALGLPVGFAGLYFILHPAAVTTHWASPGGLWHVLVLAAGLGWIMSYQIGMLRNLRHQNVSRWVRIQHCAVMLILTPLTGLCETVGPFVAVVRWLFGARRAAWTPTPKVDGVRLLPEAPAPEGA